MREVVGGGCGLKAPQTHLQFAAPSLSYSFCTALTSALERDPVDAANDAGLLALVLDRRASAVLATSQAELMIEKARNGQG